VAKISRYHHIKKVEEFRYFYISPKINYYPMFLMPGKKIFVFILLFSLRISQLQAQTYQPTWESVDKRPVPSWFTDAKFGIFIHWGVYSVPAYRPVSKKMYETYAEWYEPDVYANAALRKSFHNRHYGEDFKYRDFAPMFKAELFDPEYWANLFVRSGAKYVVLTSKHHDGFCMWPTKVPSKKNWNSMDTGPKRDLLGDLSKAVRAKGLKMGLYFSLMEWESTSTNGRHNGQYLMKEEIDKYKIPEDKYVDENMMPQLKELVTNYQPSIIFSDGEWDKPAAYWKSAEFLSWLYNNAPNKQEVVVNDRWGIGTRGVNGGYHTSEYSSEADKVSTAHPWEESRGMGQSYGFNRAENIDDYNTSEQLVHELVSIVSRGGNLLLNIGPDGDGTIPVIMQQRLADIGDWLQINGEAIYGTSPWLTEKPGAVKTAANPQLYYTAKNKTVYVISPKWPEKNILVVGAKGTPGTRVTMLGVDGAVKFTNTKTGVLITVPAVSPAKVKGKYAYVFKVENVTKAL
jgi:alpha-L-fucosidase